MAGRRNGVVGPRARWHGGDGGGAQEARGSRRRAGPRASVTRMSGFHSTGKAPVLGRHREDGRRRKCRSLDGPQPGGDQLRPATGRRDGGGRDGRTAAARRRRPSPLAQGRPRRVPISGTPATPEVAGRPRPRQKGSARTIVPLERSRPALSVPQRCNTVGAQQRHGFHRGAVGLLKADVKPQERCWVT